MIINDSPEEEKISAPERRSRLARARNWYKKIEGPFSSISLIGGFVFDAVTLKRVDMFWENFWVIIHLLIVAICIILINRTENEKGSAENPEKLHFWLVNVLQFFFGGILSTYLVFYFRSGSFWTSWPFMLILALAFVANERLKRHYTRMVFQISLLFLSFYAFAIYLIPVLFHEIGQLEFILSGITSLAAIIIFLRIMRRFSKERRGHGVLVYLAIMVIFIGINVLYFFNFIPPIPLSLKETGLYHSLQVNAPGNYTVTEEPQSPWDFLQISEEVHLQSYEPLYAYSAVFSPGLFNTTVIHEWQHYDETSKAWVNRGRVVLPVVGGRDGGYRTYSEQEGLDAGKWRVNVETPLGQVIGRINFSVIIQDGEPMLQTKTIN